MAATEERKPGLEKTQDPQTQSFIEHISYFEHFNVIEADNDNARASHTPKQADSACFDAWAMPEFMRH